MAIRSGMVGCLRTPDDVKANMRCRPGVDKKTGDEHCFFLVGLDLVISAMQGGEQSILLVV